MKKRMCISGRCIEYTLVSSHRAKRIRINVYGDGAVRVTSPRLMMTAAESFVMKKSQWIFKKLDYVKEFPAPVIRKRKERTNFLRYRDDALRLAHEKVRQFNSHYGFAVNSICIRNQKTRWGSCSKKGNLNFNYKIAFLSPRLSDYIVVHELCHLAELNHSPNFWRLVARTIPDHADMRKELKHVHKNALLGERK